eukprot:TRINITY_DN12071_c0_g1_i1.p3 TRINITY_DN12071_c0_g1~~TRINITY_DN12071_c0_g1_i1.p3  ORF type:complete len:196 (-),score=32.73 TRINITY_DN12071_c0_g1_i1:563-1150(-)
MLRWTFVACLAAVSALEFELADPQRPKCFTEELPAHTEVEAFVSASSKVVLSVTDNSGHNIRRLELVPEKQRVAYYSTSAGDNVFCFFAEHAGSAPVKINFDLRSGVGAIDYEHGKALDRLRPLEIKLRMTEDVLIHVHREYLYQEQRERELRELNERMNTRAVTVAVVVLILAAVIGSAQVKHLQSHFQRIFRR